VAHGRGSLTGQKYSHSDALPALKEPVLTVWNWYNPDRQHFMLFLVFERAQRYGTWYEVCIF
jgi:hypothetical protein